MHKRKLIRVNQIDENADNNKKKYPFHRHNAIDEALDKCDKLSNEDNYIMSYLLRGGYIG